jgi:hypothetical protein
MKAKLILISILILTYSSLSRSQSTEIVYLSGTDAADTVMWDFFCTDGMNSGHWTKIKVPSNWELQGFGIYNYGDDWQNKEKKQGQEHGLYRYEFTVPSGWKGKTVNIVFDGSMTDTDVKINGFSAGKVHRGAFYRFKYDISKLLKYGKNNILEVDVAKHSSNESVNRAERQADYWIFGGIFRPVYLEALPPVHIKRAAIDAGSDGSFNILTEINRTRSDYIVTIKLFDTDGKEVNKPFSYKLPKGKLTGTFSGSFDGITSWNPEKPVLYDIKISLKKGNQVLHTITERTGFRTVEVRKHDGIYVNGRKVILKGINRHSFRPETGRCLSDEDQMQDIMLMKEMNINAVRMSHYVPDKRFLDLCDSLGMFVLDELAGWQDSYDTIVGPKLIKELILKDENHPCIILWDHGNESGWNPANEKWFDYWDIQKRTVIRPWASHNGINTHHYPAYDYALYRFTEGNDIFMPTEFLHGLYDGGHGAGLDDFWTKYETSPLFAGGFLWVYADEAVLRTDKEGLVYDSHGNRAPDGVLGPHLEKEGSFYTLKEIWSPVQAEPFTVNKQWNGDLILKNKFIYTNLNECSLKWEAVRSEPWSDKEMITGSGSVSLPDTKPGESSLVSIDHGNTLKQADLIRFKVTDPNGMLIYSISKPVIQPSEKTKDIFTEETAANNITTKETDDLITVTSGDITISFRKSDGTISNIKNKNGHLSFSGGPVPVGVDSEVKNVKWSTDISGNFTLEINYSSYPQKAVWTLFTNGLLYLEAGKLDQKLKDIDYIGISFNYPEGNCTSVTWLGDGPYRVWKNRLKGNTFGVWKKDYNNTITGESFNDLIYPEFKGYHARLFWMELETTESPVRIATETPNLYFRLFTPGKPGFVAGGTYPPFPSGDISFLYEIPAIGTKFKMADKLGPQSQKGIYSRWPGDEDYPIKLWFDLRGL